MLIAVPSKGRAGSTVTDKFLKKSVLFVPKSEYHQYKQYNNNVEIVPNEIKGITATRNYILKNSDQRRVVFLDDDLKTQGYTKLFSENGKQIKLKADTWYYEFDRLFDITEQCNYFIWGVKTEAALRSVYPYKPINFRSYVTASCMGIINTGKYYFDESFQVKEDYEICLRHIENEGGIIAARYLHWENSHWGDDGGCKDYRTQLVELDCIKKLLKLYPSRIKQITRGGSNYSIQLNL